MTKVFIEIDGTVYEVPRRIAEQLEAIDCKTDLREFIEKIKINLGPVEIFCSVKTPES